MTEGGAGFEVLGAAHVGRVLDAIAQRVAIVRREGPSLLRVVAVNGATAAWRGVSAEELVGRDLRDLIGPERWRSMAPRYAEAIATRRAVDYLDVSVRDGERRDVAASIVPLGEDASRRPILLWLATDVSLERWSREVLRRQHMLLDAVSDAVITTDADLVVTGWNRAAEEVYGWTGEEIVGRSATELWAAPVAAGAELAAALEQLVRAGVWRGEVEHRRRDGAEVRVLATVSPLRHEDGGVQGFVSVNKDVTDWRRATSRLEHLALHDALTGLANRAGLMDALARMLAPAAAPGTVCVAFLDLNEMKLVNDSLGHDAGDAVLVAVAERLRGAVRPGDVVARIGGDEFVVAAVVEHDEAADALADRLHAALGAPVQLPGRELRCSASIGIATARAGDGPEQLLIDADAAMYAAKEQRQHGRTQRFDASMREGAQRRLRDLQALRVAVEHGDFTLHHQPIVDLAAGEPVGVEALLRWQRDGQAVPPATFIPLAERSGLVVALGAWVLDEALRQLRAWVDAGHGDLVMAVNVSALQLQDAGFPDLVRAALERHGVDGAQLVLEITEGVFLGDHACVRATLDAVVGLGARFAVDDFGTGFSSLAYLRDLPVSAVKLDRAFVARIARSARDDALVRAAIDLAHVLDLRVVGEGIETEAQAQRLRELGCDFGQGYHLGRPAPAEALGWVRRAARGAAPVTSSAAAAPPPPDATPARGPAGAASARGRRRSR